MADLPMSSPCARCAVDQYCCRFLTSLRLPASEFDRLFARHQEKLLVQRRGPVVRISCKPGEVCPYWDNGCSIYEKRPVECRLYPYGLGSVVFWRTYVLVTYRIWSGCPHEAELLIPRADARDLVATLAGQAFPGCTVGIVYEWGFLHNLANVTRWLVLNTKRLFSKS